VKLSDGAQRVELSLAVGASGDVRAGQARGDRSRGATMAERPRGGVQEPEGGQVRLRGRERDPPGGQIKRARSSWELRARRYSLRESYGVAVTAATGVSFRMIPTSSVT